jgi:crossover junction endodeoxyribonuclease RusA
MAVIIELPPVNAKLHAHNKGHWRIKAGPTKALLNLAAGLTAVQMMKQRIRRGDWSSAVVDYSFSVPDRRRRDVVNMMQSQKAAIDGVVSAGLIPDDDWQHLTVGTIIVRVTKPAGVILTFTRT